MAIGNRRRLKRTRGILNLQAQSATVGVKDVIEGDIIDWSTANVYTKDISSDQSFSFINDEEGKKISVILKNTSDSPVTISFPGGLRKKTTLQNTLQPNTQSVYSLVKAGNNVYIHQDVFDTLTEFPDTDGDGVADNLDAFPNDPAETVDTDGDGVGDNADAFPNDATKSELQEPDTDGDGVVDSLDSDIDGDGIVNEIDNAPLVANPDQADVDQDGIADVLDPDIDGDGVANELDNEPLIANPDQADTDGDGLADITDPDIDGDGVTNELDAFPNDASESTDTDGDGVGDNADVVNDSLLVIERGYYIDSSSGGPTRINGDEKSIEIIGITTQFNSENLSGKIIKFTHFDNFDNVVQEYTAVVDGLVYNYYDSSGTGLTNLKITYSSIQPEVVGIKQFNNIEVSIFSVYTIDSDGDGVGDSADAFPNDATETLDTDGDGVGDNADALPNDPLFHNQTSGPGTLGEGLYDFGLGDEPAYHIESTTLSELNNAQFVNIKFVNGVEVQVNEAVYANGRLYFKKSLVNGFDQGLLVQQVIGDLNTIEYKWG